MATLPEEPWDLVIARITAPFGIKGAVAIRLETDFPERFRKLKQVRLELATGEERPARIRSVKQGPKGLLLTFAGCSDRGKAEELRGAWIKIRQSMAMPLPEDAYYHHQLLGLRVFTEAGEDLGEITNIIESPANDVYETPKALIPALKHVVKQIDLESKRMVVALPEEEGSGE